MEFKRNFISAIVCKLSHLKANKMCIASMCIMIPVALPNAMAVDEKNSTSAEMVGKVKARLERNLRHSSN